MKFLFYALYFAKTILLSIVKASFSFNLSCEIWDQLMNLLSSVNSFTDVVEKWIEVIDDLVRQIIKSNYAVDINNLPTVETTMDHKRKLKKKQLQNSTNILPVASYQHQFNDKQSLLALSEQQQQLIKMNNNLGPLNQQLQLQTNIIFKARAQTDINPAAFFHPSSSSFTIGNDTLATQTLNQIAASTIMITTNDKPEYEVSKITNTNCNNNLSSTNHISPGEPTLNRQRKSSFFIQYSYL